MIKNLRAIAVAVALGLPALAHAALPIVEVYKSETCGCCEEWIKHLKANGFTVKATNVPNPSDYREKFGIPEELGSCHTAKVGKYAVEGHVPASDIKRLVASGAKARGLAVPAMPVGSPGMEMGGHSEPYDVLLVHADGRSSVYKHYSAKP